MTPSSFTSTMEEGKDRLSYAPHDQSKTVFISQLLVPRIHELQGLITTDEDIQ